MQVRVRLFAVLRERAGADELELELPEGARVRDALRGWVELAGGRAARDGGQPGVRAIAEAGSRPATSSR